MFPLPRTDLGGGAVLGFNAVALLDRPASMLKDNLRDYRRLGLYVESRIALREAMPCFWARGNADDSIERNAAAAREAPSRGPRATGASPSVYAASPALYFSMKRFT
jgi:hypothetical protein